MSFVFTASDWQKNIQQQVSQMAAAFYARKRLYSTLIVLSTAVLLLFLFWPRPVVLNLPGLVQAQEVSNASKLGGRVRKIWVQEGDSVEAGQILIEFEDDALAAQVIEAEATLEQAKARYTLLKRGAQPEDLSQARSQVQQASEKLQLLKGGSTIDTLKQAQASVQEAGAQNQLAQDALQKGESLLASGVISSQKLDSLRAQAQGTRSALDAAQARLNQLKKGTSSEEIAIARAQVNSAQAAYKKLAKGSQAEDLIMAQADVDKAQSALQAVRDQLDELSVQAPIDGVVTVLNAKPGELVPPGRPVVTIIDTKRLWSDVYVPESSLGGLKPKMPVEASASVYPKARFNGKIAFISPKSEFVPSGSGRASFSEESNFRVKVLLAAMDTKAKVRLRPGMKLDVKVVLEP